MYTMYIMYTIASNHTLSTLRLGHMWYEESTPWVLEPETNKPSKVIGQTPFDSILIMSSMFIRSSSMLVSCAYVSL